MNLTTDKLEMRTNILATFLILPPAFLVLGTAVAALAPEPRSAREKCGEPEWKAVWKTPCPSYANVTSKVRKATLVVVQADLYQSAARKPVEVPNNVISTRSEQLEDAAGSGAVLVGQSSEQVRRAWGDPSFVHRTFTTASASEQWVFEASQVQSRYVYLAKGVVTGIQE